MSYFLYLLAFILIISKTKDGNILNKLKNINKIIDLRVIYSIKLFTLTLLLNI